MSNIAIIYPNQLFELRWLPYNYRDVDYFIITEDCLFFNDKERKLKFNMLKLIYQRACMKYYEHYLKSKNQRVLYLDFNKNPNYLFKKINEKFGRDNNIYIIDPVDRILEKRIKLFSKKYVQNIILYESPSFLLDNYDLEDYMKKKKNKKFYQYNFYIWHRKTFDILMDVNNKPIGGKYTYDKYNRKNIPGKNFNKFLKDNNIRITNKVYKNKFYRNAIKYCNLKFKNYYPENYNPDNIYLYPITHIDARKHFINFMMKKLKYFGDFQDAIDFDEPYMFHSVISPQLNNGLLIPRWIEDKLLVYFKSIKKKTVENIKNIEGFFRQLNWREYSRLLYRYAYNDIKKKNYFKNRNKITQNWYIGKTGILPIDKSICFAFRYGYLHHIIRLMILCNFMNLCSINPHDVYNWFMEFSLDSYDWVMINNVYSMGLYADGGITTTKPYISSSNYVLKMSNITKDDYWNKCWDILYYYFIYRNYDKLRGRASVYKSQWDKRKDKSIIIKSAKKIINRIMKSNNKY